LGGGLTLPFLVIYIGEVRDLGLAFAGFLVAYTAIVALLAAGPVGSLVDRYGPKPVMLIALTVMATGVGMLALVQTYQAAIAVATVVALGQSGTWAPQSALYARVTPREHRQKIFGLQFMMLNLGLGVGGLVSALIVNLEDPSTFQVLYILDALTFLVYVGVLLSLPGIGVGPELHEDLGHALKTTRGYQEVFADRAMRRLIIGSLVLLTFGYGSLEVGLPIYATVIGDLDVGFLGLAYGVNTGVIVIGQLFIIKKLKGRSRSRAAALVGGIWAVSWLFVGASISFAPFVAGLLICFGIALFAIGETIWSPVIPAIVNELASPELRGRYNAILSVTWGVSGAIGPAFAGVLLGFDLPVLWIGLVVVGCLFSGLLLLRLRPLLTLEQDGMIAA
jgi:MFS family permease